jgi:hypothetical protein
MASYITLPREKSQSAKPEAHWSARSHTRAADPASSLLDY